MTAPSFRKVGKPNLRIVDHTPIGGVEGVQHDIERAAARADCTSFPPLSAKESARVRKLFGLPDSPNPARSVPDDHINDGSTPGAEALIDKK